MIRQRTKVAVSGLVIWLAATAAVAWASEIPLPPAEHPRLYLTSRHVAQLPERRAHHVLQPVVQRWQVLARRNKQFQLEWDALEYLTSRDRDLGLRTVADTLTLLQQTELPDINDACRVTGRVMVTGAIVYDWHYELLTQQQKQQYIAELIRLAKTLECGYPPTRQGSVTGHSSEAMIMRDMISAGIAIYDEYPEMYQLAARRFFEQHLPARNWLYDGHAYHQGDSYGPYRFSWDTFPLWIFDRLGAGNVYNPQQSQVPYSWIYATRPDGQRLRAGDTFMHSQPRGTPWGVGIGPLLVASYYHDPVVLGHYEAQRGNRDNELIFEFLWRDLELKPEQVSELPTTRYFGSPFGSMVARTGWDADSVIAEMKINEYNFTNHQHLDAGAFQLYYRGPLAIDSGVYTGSSGRYGSPHCRNYYWRTIAHNCLLIHDPDEDFDARGGYGNDGGQRLPNRRREPANLAVLREPQNGYQTGQVLAWGCGPDAQRPEYSLLQGDLTAAYSDKVQQVTRSFVFLSLGTPQTPAALIVLDRVVARDPAFRKFWLLHALEEPRLTETGAIVDVAQHAQHGRLVLDTLWPAAPNRRTELIGGPGKEYWVFGENFANDQPARTLARSSMELGAWRVEVAPRQPSREDLFLNVMQVTDREAGQTLPVERCEAPPYVGCRLQGAKHDWLVLLRPDGAATQRALTVVLPGDRLCRTLITNLAPGNWQAKSAQGESVAVTVAAESGAAWWTGQGGRWQLTRDQ